MRVLTNARALRVVGTGSEYVWPRAKDSGRVCTVGCRSEEVAADEAEHVVLQLTGLHARAQTGVARHEEGQDVVWPSRLGDAGVALVAGPHYKILLE